MDPARHGTAPTGADSTGDAWPPSWWPTMPWIGEPMSRLEHVRVVRARRWPPRRRTARRSWADAA